ncbi:hypothetical protein [Neobacillus sp. DY30]|nr:hypothetical protein [Neobacillus sp. DY30]WHY01730.1 hypothetical protein QNH29_05655 [Neobacillus sp. DY30]
MAIIIHITSRLLGAHFFVMVKTLVETKDNNNVKSGMLRKKE